MRVRLLLCQCRKEESRMSKRLYVAYGSNLNIQQMKYRCPTAKLYGTGNLEGYELQFKGYPNSAFATISPKAGSSVPVAVWDIQPHDEKSLDRYEGYPSHYFKENVVVNLGDEEVSAMVYIMNQKMKFGLPSTNYYNTVLTGYNDCGLDTVALETALKESTQQFYSSAVRQSHQMSFYNFDDEDLSDDEELEENEPDISDPFYSFDGMKY